MKVALRAAAVRSLPSGALHLVKGLGGMFWRGSRTNSQFAEDIFVGKFFQSARVGTWLDIGAFHPRVASNTERLRRRGWSGINVDADPAKIRVFQWFRRGDVNICAAVAGPERHRAVLDHRTPSSYGSMDRLELTSGPAGMITRTVGEILAEVAPDRLDFVSIDVEGLEADILAAFPFDRYAPDLFCVEVLDTTIEGITDSGVSTLLADQGYRIVGWFPPSVFFARRPFGLGRD